MPESENLYPILTETAQLYCAQGYSVIPLAADSKVAATGWKDYQRRRATAAVIETWFARQGHGGVAIVCGAISQLAVLDFDDDRLRLLFERDFPHLTHTRRIKSRRGEHYYFHIPPHLRLATRHVPGVDLLYTGSYVVAPPTVIDGQAYTIARGGKPLTLTQHDINAINTWLDAQSAVDTSAERSWMLAPAPAEIAPATAPLSTEPYLSLLDIVDKYHQLAPIKGRNNALFAAAQRARDCGWSQVQTELALTQPHVDQPPVGPHKPEAPHQREIEAQRTISSAFSRPARRRRDQIPQLYNSIRETLFQLGETRVVRVIEALRLNGVTPGTIFTTNQAKSLLTDIVGNHSIEDALKAVAPTDERLFALADCAEIPPEAPPLPAEAASCTLAKSHVPNARDSVSKPEKIKSGRKSIGYIMPDNATLCRLLEIKPSISDPLTLDDLKSAKTTRQACHRAAIKRKPGQYSLALLSDRLGVSRSTVQRYNRDLPDLHSLPMFRQVRLHWGNLSELPPEDEPHAGVFIETNTGKRYKPLLGIARKLLKRGEQVYLMFQEPNFYWVGDMDQPPIYTPPYRRLVEPQPEESRQAPRQRSPGITPERIAHFKQLIAQRFSLDKAANTSEPTATIEPLPPLPAPRIVYQRVKPPSPPKSPTQRPKRPRNFYRQPLPGQAERIAQRVYATINQRVTEPEHKLSLVNARRWIDVYGVDLVERGLQVLTKRQNIYQPAGFLATWLRGAQKFSPTATS